jgi:hypothetical protein
VNTIMKLRVPQKAGEFHEWLSNYQFLKKDCSMTLVIGH